MLKTFFFLVVVISSIQFAQAQDSVTVTDDNAKLRISPTSTGKVIETLAKDTSCKLLKERAKWSKIRTAKHVGWIENTSIELPRYELVNPTKDYSTGGGVGAGMGMGRGVGQGSGYGTGSGVGSGSSAPAPNEPTTGFRIVSKRGGYYTEEARRNNIQGVVTLRINFLANGKIGPISVVKGLDFGLTEQAIAAAREIVFEPAQRNGSPVTVVKLVNFTFNLF
jgi:TonB family protein